MVAAQESHRPDPALLEDLKARIRRIEGLPKGRDGAVLPFGVAAVDGVLPGGGLPRAALHAVAGSGRDGDRAASGFSAALLARLAGADGTVLWCRRDDDLYGPGLTAFGLEIGRLVVIRAHRPADLLWAMEESLRSGTPAAVLGEVASVAPVAARRLQLAAETGRVTALLLFSGKAAAGRVPAATRWRVAAVPSLSPYPGPGPSRWDVELLRCRGGGVGSWTLEWRDGTESGFALAADVPDRPADPAAGADGGPDRTAAVRRVG